MILLATVCCSGKLFFFFFFLLTFFFLLLLDSGKKDVRKDMEEIYNKTMMRLMHAQADAPEPMDVDLGPCSVCRDESDDLIPCTHCSHTVCSVCTRQCEACMDFFCTVCSRLDYSFRFEKAFCYTCYDAVARQRMPARPTHVH